MSAQSARRALLQAQTEDRFERITRLGRRAFGVPVAAILLFDGDRVWIKSCQGLTDAAASEEMHLCANGGNVDPSHAVKFCAVQPLTSADGATLGVLCVLDYRPRSLDEEDTIILRDLAAWAETELKAVSQGRAQLDLIAQREELRTQAHVDKLTGAWTRASIEDRLKRELARAERENGSVGLLMIDADHFKNVNDTFGHLAGDAVLRELVVRIRRTLRHDSAIGRFGGEEFLVLLPGAGLDQASAVAERTRRAVAEGDFEIPGGTIPVTISIGVAVATGAALADSIVEIADAALYRAKKAGRNRVEHGQGAET